MRFVRGVLPLLVALAVLAGPSGPHDQVALAQEAEGDGEKAEPKVTFEFENANVRMVVGAIGDIAGANLIVGPEVEGTVTLSFKGVTWREALTATVEPLGYVIVEDSHGILRIADPSRVKPPAPVPAGGPLVTLEVHEKPLSEVLPFISRGTGVNLLTRPQAKDVKITLMLKDLPWRKALDTLATTAGLQVDTVGEHALRVVKAPRVTFQFENADIRVVTKAIADIAGANVVLGGELEGTVTMTLRNVPWRPALDAILASLGYVAVEPWPGIVLICDPANLPPPSAGGTAAAKDSTAMSLAETPLAEAVRFLGLLTKVKFVVDPAVAEVPISLSVEDLPVREILGLFAETARCDIVDVGPNEIHLLKRPRVTFEFSNADVRVVVKAISDIAGVSVVIGNDVAGTVTMSLHDVSWRDALEATVVPLGYTVIEKDGGVLHVGSE